MKNNKITEFIVQNGRKNEKDIISFIYMFLSNFMLDRGEI